MTFLAVCPGPDRELARHPAGIRWCYGCRRRLPHDHVLRGYGGPSYVDPLWLRLCSGCGHDRTAFPGTDGGDDRCATCAEGSGT